VEWWPDPPHSRHPGPAAVVASALPRIPGEWLMVVPGDQPFLEPGALLRWWELARSLPAEVTSLWDPRDRIQPAFQLHRLTRTRPLGRRLLEGPVPDLRMSSLLRGSARCALVDLRGLTEHPWSFRSLNRPKDRRRPPTTPGREVPEPPHWIGPSASTLFWRGVAAYRKGDPTRTYLAFFEEAKTHATDGRWLLSLHALEDSHRAPFRSA
jgi:molybdopterin-guanine dinucleotide biosynthesis protein A